MMWMFYAIGTNFTAISAMMKNGAKNRATGENPVIVDVKMQISLLVQLVL